MRCVEPCNYNLQCIAHTDVIVVGVVSREHAPAPAPAYSRPLSIPRSPALPLSLSLSRERALLRNRERERERERKRERESEKRARELHTVLHLNPLCATAHFPFLMAKGVAKLFLEGNIAVMRESKRGRQRERESVRGNERASERASERESSRCTSLRATVLCGYRHHHHLSPPTPMIP